VILDVREPEEFARGHVPKAVNLPQGDLATRLAEVPRDRPVMTICQSGSRSLRSAQFLRQQGFDQVVSVAGGTAAWRAAGRPVDATEADSGPLRIMDPNGRTPVCSRRTRPNFHPRLHVRQDTAVGAGSRSVSMTITRRDLLAGAAAAVGSAAARALTAQLPPGVGKERGDTHASRVRRSTAGFPAEGRFRDPGRPHVHQRRVHASDACRGGCGNAEVCRCALVLSDRRCHERRMSRGVKAAFASLINAKPSEISFIPNTSTGENLVVNGLEIAEQAKHGINVVTDALHFDGSILNLQLLKRDRGLDLRIVMPRDNGARIDLHDMEKVIDRKTKLVEVSLVAMYNGFQHDLKAVCDLAHANGAYVYADIIQAAGASPIDVKATGVDFAACASFKWLMADFGRAFCTRRRSCSIASSIARSAAITRRATSRRTSSRTTRRPRRHSRGSSAPMRARTSRSAATRGARSRH
jgi:rhodanese-related sulfurtransferase